MLWCQIRAVGSWGSEWFEENSNCSCCIGSTVPAAAWKHALSWCNRLGFVSYTCSLHFKPLCLFRDFLLSHALVRRTLNLSVHSETLLSHAVFTSGLRQHPAAGSTSSALRNLTVLHCSTLLQSCIWKDFREIRKVFSCIFRLLCCLICSYFFFKTWPHTVLRENKNKKTIREKKITKKLTVLWYKNQSFIFGTTIALKAKCTQSSFSL